MDLSDALGPHETGCGVPPDLGGGEGPRGAASTSPCSMPHVLYRLAGPWTIYDRPYIDHVLYRLAGPWTIYDRPYIDHVLYRLAGPWTRLRGHSLFEAKSLSLRPSLYH